MKIKKWFLVALSLLSMSLISCQQKLDIESNWKEVSSQILVLREGAEWVKKMTVPDRVSNAEWRAAEADSIRVADSIAAIEAAAAEAAAEAVAESAYFKRDVLSREDIIKKNREDSIYIVNHTKTEGVELAQFRFCIMFLNSTAWSDSIGKTEDKIRYSKTVFEELNKVFERNIFEAPSEKDAKQAKIYAQAFNEEYNRLLNIYENNNPVNIGDYNIVEGPDGEDGSKNYKITSKNSSIENYFVSIGKGQRKPIINLRLVNPEEDIYKQWEI